MAEESFMELATVSEGESFQGDEEYQAQLPETPPDLPEDLPAVEIDATATEGDVLVKTDQAGPQLPIAPVGPEDGKSNNGKTEG